MEKKHVYIRAMFLNLSYNDKALSSKGEKSICKLKIWFPTAPKHEWNKTVIIQIPPQKKNKGIKEE